MKTLLIKAVVLTDGEHFLIHGCDNESPQEMFRVMAPIWTFDPSKETAHFVELSVSVPEWEKPWTAEVAEPVDRMELTLADFKHH